MLCLLGACAEPPPDLVVVGSGRVHVRGLQGEPVSAEFGFEVHGREPVHLLSEEHSCGCARVEFSATTRFEPDPGEVPPEALLSLAPGSTGRIRLSIDTKRRSGDVEVLVLLKHTGASGQLRLTAVAKVAQPFDLEPQVLDYAELCAQGHRTFLGVVRPRRPGGRELHVASVPLGWRVETAQGWDCDRPVWLVRVSAEHPGTAIQPSESGEIVLTDQADWLARWKLVVPAPQIRAERPVVGLEPAAGGGLHARVLVRRDANGALEPTVRLGEWNVELRLVAATLAGSGSEWQLQVRVAPEALATGTSGFVSGAAYLDSGGKCGVASRVMFVGRP
jgi:hypothetical protein